MLASERYKGKHERATWTNIVGKVYFGNDPQGNIVQGNMLYLLENKIREYLKMPEISGGRQD